MNILYYNKHSFIIIIRQWPILTDPWEGIEFMGTMYSKRRQRCWWAVPSFIKSLAGSSITEY